LGRFSFPTRTRVHFETVGTDWPAIEVITVDAEGYEPAWFSDSPDGAELTPSERREVFEGRERVRPSFRRVKSGNSIVWIFPHIPLHERDRGPAGVPDARWEPGTSP